ncbi:MAG: N-acetylmuramoyl-L-alanine amidase [Sphingomonadaceae bacterium]|nr:N-acetylmuramoyl-L-alanine amidase [Sphingomonadaceae bacterium]
MEHRFTLANARLFDGGARVPFVPARNMGAPFPEPPEIAVIHFTGGGSARSSAAWFADPRNRSSSAHVVIDRDGSVIQCVPFDRQAWHAGVSAWRGLTGLNRYSWGIELANWGWLQRMGAGWADGAGRPVQGAVLAAHRHGNPGGDAGPIGWEPYPSAQVAAAAALCGALGVREVVGHDDIAPGRKSDPGPAFDMPAFRARVFAVPAAAR